jgi:hypothetical protein
MRKANAMKTPILAAMIFAVCSSSAMTQPAPANAAKNPPMAGMRMDDNSMAQMQERMKKMQDHMTRMQKTTDQAERRKLMDEHMKEMQEGMTMMRGMGGGMMQGMMGGAGKVGPGAGQGAGPGTGTGTGSGPGPGAGSGPMGVAKGGRTSPQMMEQRLDMMQMLMEQLMKHQQMQAPAK